MRLMLFDAEPVEVSGPVIYLYEVRVQKSHGEQAIAGTSDKAQAERMLSNARRRYPSERFYLHTNA